MQDQIQLCHCHHPQATIFTWHSWIDKEVNESIVIVSDYLEHDKILFTCTLTIF